MEEEEVPLSSPDSPIPLHINNGSNRHPQQGENNNTNNNIINNNPDQQYSHLRTLYHIQNMLTRQLMPNNQTQQSQNNVINNNEHVAINMDGSPRDRNHNSVNTNNNINNINNINNAIPANAGETIAAQGIDGSRFDLQLLTSWLEQSFPFILLLIIIWIYQHRNGIFLFAWACVIFINANQAVKRQVALKEKRSVVILAGIALGLVFHILFANFYFREEQLWRYLLLLPPKRPLVIWDTFWVIVMNDFVVRYATMIVKCVVIIMIGQTSPHKRNTQLYSIIEAASNAYRTVLPMSLWFKYMFRPQELVSNLVSLLYLLAKFNHFYERVSSLTQASKAYLLRDVQYGKYASREQVMEAGDQCTICQETMASPIVLHCNHIFCEDCVSEWFEREKTCPLCRANVPTAGNRSHSDGTTSLLVQLF